MTNQNKYLNDIVSKNENKTNYIMSILSLAMSILFIAYVMLINYDNSSNALIMQKVMITFELIMFIGPILCFIFKGDKVWLKYIITLCFVISSVCSLLLFEPGIYITIILIPVVASCLYFDSRFTMFAGAAAIVSSFIVITLNTLFLNILHFDMNHLVLVEGVTAEVNGNVYDSLLNLEIDRGAYFFDMLQSLLIPMFIGTAFITLVCMLITEKARQLTSDQTNEIENAIKANSELNLAASIQDSLLSNNVLNNKKYEVNYYISQSKQVGGDFYDYFMIDGSKLALVIADVSDKGVPASLFMARCKTLISSALLTRLSLSEAINKVNRELCQKNANHMYVTAFIGIVDINTGELEYINAGHYPPIIMDGDKTFKPLDVEVNIFLGSMNDINYSSHKVNIKENEKLLLYTDGVIDALNIENEKYDKERLLFYLNSNSSLPNDELINGLVNDIEEFSRGMEQSDDITMLLYTRKSND